MATPLRTGMLLLATVLLLPNPLRAQTFRLTATDVPRHVNLPLPSGDYDPQAAYALVDPEEPTRSLPAQVVRALNPDGTLAADKFRLLVSLPSTNHGDTTTTYQLKETEGAPTSSFSFSKTDLRLKLVETVTGQSATRPVWQYNYGTIVDESVPQDDPRRTRGCYVHPLWGLHGEILTDDFPKDHYHHHGLFWTWPYVGVGDKTYDLWATSDIRQHFSKWLATDTGPVAARMGVENNWMVGSQHVATERIWLTTYCADATSRAIDLTVCVEAADQPVTLQGREHKSYGGITIRYDVTPRKDATVRVPGKSLGYGFESAGRLTW